MCHRDDAVGDGLKWQRDDAIDDGLDWSKRRCRCQLDDGLEWSQRPCRWRWFGMGGQAVSFGVASSAVLGDTENLRVGMNCPFITAEASNTERDHAFYL